MARFCGGFRFDDTLKIDKGVVTTADGTVDVDNVVTACSQLFDGAVFKVVDKTVTAVEAEDVADTVSVCGVKFDAAYFSVVDGELQYTAPVVLTTEMDAEEEPEEVDE